MNSSININPSGATPDSTYGGSSHSSQEGPSGHGPTAAPPEGEASDPADLRLLIEDDQVAGSYVYKTVDRRTGKVVQQLPREQILRLREASDYTAGAVIKAKV